MKTKNKILNVIPIVFILSLLISFITSLYFNNKLKAQLIERDNTIKVLLRRDSLLHQIIDLKTDSTGQYEYFVTMRRNGEILKYNEMYEYADSMHKIVNQLIYNDKTKQGIIDAYNDLVSSYNDIFFDYTIYKAALSNIQREYGIKYKVDTISDKHEKKIAVSLEHVNKLDSALSIFNHYKDKIKRIGYKNGVIISEIEIISVK